MNRYEEKQEARRARLIAAAEKADARADAAYRKADLREEASGIPLGQPILVGHHSERRHRRAIERADAAMRRSIDESKRAAELRGKADSVGTGGISSDDPEAIEKLTATLEQKRRAQDVMKAANRIIRQASKAGASADSPAETLRQWAERAATATGEEWSEQAMRAALTPDFCGRIGYASYALTNNNAEIRRIEKRLRELAVAADRQSEALDLGFCLFVRNAEDNRLQFEFDGKPDPEIRTLLKSHGFRWAPSMGAWQRKWTPNAEYQAKQVLAALEDL